MSSRVARDERGHEGAGPGLERLRYALSRDRVQGDAEQPGACVGVRFPHVKDQLAYGSPAEHFVRLLGSKPERVSFSGGQGGHRFSRLEAYSYEFSSPAIGPLADAAESQLAELRRSNGAEILCRKG